MSDPIQNLDTVGQPGIGEAETGFIVGSKWQMGIAVPVKNRKFEYGTVVNYRLSSGPFEESSLNQNGLHVGISSIDQSIGSWPSNLIQYGDKVLLGPSTSQEFNRFKETIRISGCQETFENSLAWSQGFIYSLDRRNRFEYQLTDSISVYGTGLASGWELKDARLSTLGINKGFASLNRHGMYSVLGSSHVTIEENSISNNHVVFSFRLPIHSSYDANLISGPHGGPSVFYSSKGLAVWRDSNINSEYGDFNQDGNWDWRLASTARGVFRYIHHHVKGDRVHIGYNSNVNTASFNLSGANIHASIITGYYHPGGQFKDTSQALFSMVREPDSQTEGSDQVSRGALRQFITTSINDAKDLSFTPLVSGTNYRLGIVWKGSLSPGGANSAGSQFWAKFQWGPILEPHSEAMISTPVLLNESENLQENWRVDTVSGFVQAAQTDYLDPEKNIKIELITKTSSPDTFLTNRQGRGTELLAFIDNVWLEHEGDIPGASGKGYIEIDHYPEMGTLQVNQQDSTNEVRILLSDGSSVFMDPTGNMYKKLYIVEADFLRVKQEVFEQIRKLLEWQSRGYLLTLHPFLPEVPHCLVGRLEIENVTKSHWDLTRFSFRLRFIETQ